MAKGIIDDNNKLITLTNKVAELERQLELLKFNTLRVIYLHQVEYDKLLVKNNNTLYVII